MYFFPNIVNPAYIWSGCIGDWCFIVLVHVDTLLPHPQLACGFEERGIVNKQTYSDMKLTADL